MTPEAQARETIDKMLSAAGWAVQDRGELNLGAARGVAVREYPLQSEYADYLLFVDRQAIPLDRRIHIFHQPNRPYQTSP